ncbi:MAG: hypothetical protein PHC62_00415 [Candidatus Izemoplasmatales bacterium]|nr:hypothetical protein [Candidatus Izemoplasmatales bacterium]
MAFSNNMTKLLNKIERRLGTRPLNLPKHLQKDEWVTVIEEETIVTYSRYYPFQLKYNITPDTPIKDGWYLLDEDVLDGVTIIGVKDISWEDFATSSVTQQQNAGYGVYDMFTNQYGLSDIMMYQVHADLMSLYNNGIYPNFEPPNMLKLENAVGSNLQGSYKNFNIYLLIEHSKSLTTITPTQMETFENLAVCDVASFLYEELKLFEGVETVYANIDLKLNDLQDKANKREDVINYIKESYVSASNKNQPMIMTI